MRIGLDARTIYTAHRRGIGKSLLRLYQTLSLVRPDWQVVAYHRLDVPDRNLPQLFAEGFVQPRMIEMPGDRFDAWHRIRLPMAARNDGVDLLHCPANACPSLLPVPTLVTIHDLIPLDRPDTVPAREARRFERQVTNACRKASAILCPSIYTSTRLVRDMGVEPERIHVAPWGAEAFHAEFSDEQIDEVCSRYRVSRPFVLHLGAPDPRKNTSRMLEAWAMIGPKIRRTWQLLVVGLDAAAQKQLLDYSYKLGIHESVTLHGFADEADMPALYAAAEVLAYPSLSEGFGLPILEAFAARTAVLTSNCTSLPEIAGDAALLVDPEDPVSLSHGLAKIVRDPTLRRDLVERGVRRLPRYTWKRCAERFAAAAESLVEQRSGVLAAA